MSAERSNNDFKKEIGLKLLRVRQLAGYSQQNVAYDLNFSPTTYSKIENGKVEITVSRLLQLADYFKVFAPDFLNPEIEIPRQVSEVKSISEYNSIESKYEFLKEIVTTTGKL